MSGKPTKSYVRVCKAARDAAEALLFEASEIHNRALSDMEGKALLKHAARAYTDAEDRYMKVLESYHE